MPQLLNALDNDWLITFQKTNVGEARPVFWCKICSFDYTMQLHLENVLNENLDLAKLLRPLIFHQKVCKAFHMPLLQNTRFHGIQLPPMQTSDRFYEYRFILYSVTAPVPGRVVASMATHPDQDAD